MFSAVLREFHRTLQHPLPPLPNPHLVTPLISNLRENWHCIHDLDRALAVWEIIQLGVSRRRVAREIGFSEGLLRHLLKALEATPSDIELARQNAISTNELVRRAKPRSIAADNHPDPSVGRPVINAAKLFRPRPRLDLPPLPVPLLPFLPAPTWRKR